MKKLLFIMVLRLYYGPFLFYCLFVVCTFLDAVSTRGRSGRRGDQLNRPGYARMSCTSLSERESVHRSPHAAIPVYAAALVIAIACRMCECTTVAGGSLFNSHVSFQDWHGAHVSLSLTSYPRTPYSSVECPAVLNDMTKKNMSRK